MCAIDSNYLAPCGPAVDALEKKLVAYAGMKGALATTGGTSALALIFRHLGIVPGDIVICSDLTFIASIAPAVQLGARPVFVDSRPETWTMDPELLRRALADYPRAKAVVTVDLYGQCSDYDTLEAICAEAGVPLIVDAAEAMGSTYKGRPAGQAGAAAIYSFNGNKIITASGGGALVSNDTALVNNARRLSMQAREPAAWYEHRETGYNCHLSNVLAALVSAQFDHLTDAVAAKQNVFDRYRELLRNDTRFELMPEAATGVSNRWLTVLTVKGLPPPAELGMPSEIVCSCVARFDREGIEVRPVWKPMHSQPVFSGMPCYGGAVAENLFYSGLCLPSGTGLTYGQQERIVALLKEFCDV